MVIDGQRYSLDEAEPLVLKRICQRHGHVFEVVINKSANMPVGVRCSRCNDNWRVFHPVDPPTQIIHTIDAPTRFDLHKKEI